MLHRINTLVFVFILAFVAAAQAAGDVASPDGVPAAAPPAFIFGQAFHILPQTHNREAASLSLCEGLDSKLFVGTSKDGVDSYLIELNPDTGDQRLVIDTHKLCSYIGVGFAAQSQIRTHNFVGSSGRIYVGSSQDNPGKNENPWSYPGGFLMNYDPRLDAAQSYGVVPYHGYGVVDVAADESRGLIYFVCKASNGDDTLFGVYDTKTKQHRLLGTRAGLHGGILLDAKGRVFVLTHDNRLACYDPAAEQLTVRDVLLNGKAFDPMSGTSPEQQQISWTLAPDGNTAYFLTPTNPTLYSITLAGVGNTTAATELGRMVNFDKPILSCDSLVVHPDGNIYALFGTHDPAGKAKGDVNVLARYEPKTKTMKTLGTLAIRNKDYFDFHPGPDGKPKSWSDGVQTLADGTLIPTAVHQAMIAGRDGTLYAMLSSPFAVFKITDFRIAPPPPTPARQWSDFALGLCDRTEKNMPHVTEVAEAVAQRYIAGGRLDVILNSNNGWPGQGPQAELSGRSGGVIDLGACYVPDPEDLTRPAADRANDVIIIGWQRAPTKGDVERMKLYQSRGAKILGFGPRGLPALAECAKLCDYFIDTGFDGDDHALTLADGSRVGHANTLANLLDGWVFTAEFVGACTRQGKMPPMWKAMLWKSDWEPWMNKYRGKEKFHDDIFVPPLAPGQLGKRFLDQVRWHMRKFENTQLDQVRKSAELIVEEHAKGKKTVVTIAGHCMYETVGKYEDGEWAQGIGFHGWVPYETRDYLSRAPRDALVLVLAYCGFHKEQWATFVGAGQKRLLLVTSENNTQEFPELDGPRDECLTVMDMGHAFGDACTRIDGYPFPVFPPSGIMQAMAYEAVDVEVLAKIGKQKTNATVAPPATNDGATK